MVAPRTKCLGCDKPLDSAKRLEVIDMVDPLGSVLRDSPLCETCDENLRYLAEAVGPMRVDSGETNS